MGFAARLIRGLGGAAPTRHILWLAALLLMFIGGCARAPQLYAIGAAPAVIDTSSAPLRSTRAAVALADPEPRVDRVTFGRNGAPSSTAGDRSGNASQGVLTFSNRRVSPAELLRIVAGALNVTPVEVNPPPESPLVEVPPRMSVEAALTLVDNVLATAGQELSFDNGVVYVRNSTGVGDVRLARNLIRPIRLNFIDNQTFASLAGSLIPQDRLVLPKSDPSLVIYVGPSSGSGSIEKIRSLIDTFDLRGTQAVILPLRRRDAAEIARQVQDAIGGGTTALPRLIPLPQRRAIMLVAPENFDVAHVAQLVRDLDGASAEENSPLHVYTPRHRTAADLVALLRTMGGNNTPGAPASASLGSIGTGTTAATAPGLSPGAVLPAGSPVSTVFNGPLAAGNGPVQGAVGLPPAAAASPSAPQLSAPPATSQFSAPPGGPPTILGPLLAATNVDPETNRVVFSGSAADFSVLRRALQALDQGGGQIMVEGLIMQVALNDQLQYGVQYALNNAHLFGMPISLTDTTGLSTAAGLVFSLGKSSTQVIVNALDSVTNVSVISSPKILTVSGETAHFHFGASVPVLSAALTTSQGSGAAIANQVEYRDTGVSLSVTPSAIDDTTADLSITQTLSDVSTTTVSGVNSPVFDDRKIDTHVRLHFGDTIMLGGIIEHDRNDTDTGIPGLRRLAIIGGLFGTTARTSARSEYVLLLTPRLYSDSSRGPRLSDALALRFERLQTLWNNLHDGEAFPTSSTGRLRQLRGP